MMRISSIVRQALFGLALAWPAVAGISAAPSSQPSAASLHEQAVHFMRAGQFDRALELMERAYAATPADARSRPLVLNRAIVDLRQRIHVMRALRELRAYLRGHPEPDEEALNIFGAALNMAAENPQWKRGRLWQSAHREWEQRNDRMADARPGYHRWGPYWLDQQRYDNVRGDLAQLERAIDTQSERAEAALTRVESIRLRYGALVADATVLRSEMASLQQLRDQVRDKTMSSSAVAIGEHGYDRAVAMAGNNDAQARALSEIRGAMRELRSEIDRLSQLRSEQRNLLPHWPRTFDPIELTALTPPVPSPAETDAVAASEAPSAEETARAQSPFAESGVIRAPATQGTRAASTARIGASPEADTPFQPRRIDRVRSR